LIRKQYRDRVQAPDGSGRWQEKLEVLGTYFIVGENVYQAPSIGDVVGNRLTAAANELAKFYATAKNLPTFEPERGYSYLPHATGKQKATSTNASATGTPSRSREGSLVPGAGAETQSLRSASLLPEANGIGSSQGSNYQQAVMLAESFKNTLEFADDFLDENPLIGEPGSFTYTLTTQAVKKRRADAEAELAALAAAAKAKESQVNSKVATPAGKAEKPPSPPAVMTEKAVKETREREKDRRGSKVEKMKRKKSRHSIAPSTPVSAGAASAPNSAI
jgi:mediator of RNA polymerase II transcription subunit 6